MAEDWRLMPMTVQGWIRTAMTADPAARPRWRRIATEAVPQSLQDVRGAGDKAIGHLNVAGKKLEALLEATRSLRVRHTFTPVVDEPGDPAGEPIDFLDDARSKTEGLFEHHVRAERVLLTYLAHHADRVVWDDEVLRGWFYHRFAGTRDADGALWWIRCATERAREAEEALAPLPGRQPGSKRWRKCLNAGEGLLQRAIHAIVVARRALANLLVEVDMELDHYEEIMRRFTA